MHKTLGFIDDLLGRITMYALVFYCLIALVIMACILSLTGQVAFSLVNILETVAVCFVAADLSNRLFAWLFGTKPHTESAWITGLILALLILPPTVPLDYVKLALVVMIAMASKYVLAIKNRHIFNPAAIAIVIASFANLAFAGWWIATPSMIPITIVVALLILRRTQKLRMGALYLVVAVGSLFLQGTDPYTALTSWPLLFAVGVMLSEPLTLPPHAWQQFLVAGVVGLLTTLSVHYGQITMTPALAIVIGNVIGWWFSQRGEIKLKFVGKMQMSPNTYNFVFDTPGLHFEPGQYLEMSLIHKKGDIRGHRRVFSIASKPDEPMLCIGIKLPERSSSFKRAMMELKPGAIVHATKIGGDFTLPKDPSIPVVCIAGGIGITPYISFIETGDRPIQLIYSVTSIAELSYIDTLKQHNVDVTVVSHDDGPLPDPDWQHVTGRLDKATMASLIDVTKAPVVYVSGSPGMAMGLSQVAKSIGVKHVKVDEFSGY